MAVLNFRTSFSLDDELHPELVRKILELKSAGGLHLARFAEQALIKSFYVSVTAAPAEHGASAAKPAAAEGAATLPPQSEGVYERSMVEGIFGLRVKPSTTDAPVSH